MALIPFKIDATELGNTKVELDGQDLSDQLTRVTVDIGSGRDDFVPKIYVEARGVGVLEGAGIVYERVDQSQAVVAWLMNQDPEKLEREALDNLGMDGDPGGPNTAGEAILYKLIKWAGGHADRT